MTPPDDGDESAEDSGDEDDCSDVNRFCGQQLTTQATAKVTDRGRTFRLGEESSDEEEEFIAMGNERETGESIVEVENVVELDLKEVSEGESDEEMNIPLFTLRNKLPVGDISRQWQKGIDLKSTFPEFISPDSTFEVEADPVSCFEKFFDEEIILFLTEMTCYYGRNQKHDPNFSMDSDEMRCFIAILLLSGYCTVPRWRMWWEIGTETENTSVVNAMRRNRFESIKRYLHCANNDNLPKDDKFAKVRPLIQMLNKRFLLFAENREQLSIDESMVPYFGHHGAKQFLKGKPIRYGYKMWCMNEPLGYLMTFEPYQGALKKENKAALGVGGSVVLNLVAQLPKNLPFKIYGDRFFSSLKLVHRLRQNGIGYTGTIKYNRIEKCTISDAKSMEKKKRGYFEYCSDVRNDITVTAWHDNRIVLTVSSCDSTCPEKKVDRWISSEKKKMAVNQPLVVSQYNKFMGGVDRMDQNIDNYRVGIRSKKWWWPMFAFCLDVSIHNGWQLYRRGPGKKMDYLAFRRHVVQVYLQKYSHPPKKGGCPTTPKSLPARVLDQVRFDQTEHWLAQAPKQNRCAYCKKNTTKMCSKCNLNLHGDCFIPFHKK